MNLSGKIPVGCSPCWSFATFLLLTWVGVVARNASAGNFPALSRPLVTCEPSKAPGPSTILKTRSRYGYSRAVWIIVSLQTQPFYFQAEGPIKRLPPTAREMASQDDSGIPLEHAPDGVSYKLFELPPALVEQLESDNPPVYVHAFAFPVTQGLQYRPLANSLGLKSA